jgi:hypothetical protein
MPNATATEWTKFDSSKPHVLRKGDRIRFSEFVGRRLRGKTGVFERMATKNAKATVDGVPWSIGPYSIIEYRRPTAAEKKADAEQADSGLRPGQLVITNPDNFRNDDVKPGDMLLMSPSGLKCEVARFVGVAGSKIRATRLSNGKTYKYGMDMYVQKLDNDRFA